jgi:hypothetical protein
MILTVITAHTSRAAATPRLALDLNATVFMDDGTLGEPGNTRRALQWAEQQDASHVIVVQDDAEPVDGFLERAHAAIEERPTHIISYYLGTGRPLQNYVTDLMAKADANGDQWIDTSRFIWGVAWSIPTDQLPSLNAWLTERPSTPTDTETGHWSRFNNAACTYTWPSLVDHADTDSLIHPRTERRKAWRLPDPRSTPTATAGAKS